MRRPRATARSRELAWCRMAAAQRKALAVLLKGDEQLARWLIDEAKRQNDNDPRVTFTHSVSSLVGAFFGTEQPIR